MAAHRWDLECPAPPALVVPVRVDPDGAHGPTRGQARGPGWRQTSWGFHVPADTRQDLPEQRILEQSMRLPSTGAVTGWAACRLWGGNFFDGLARDGRTPIPVPLAVGPATTLRLDGQIRLSYDRLPAAELVRRYGVRTVRQTRAVFDAARFADDVREAVVAIEMAVGARITSPERIADYTATHGGTTGIHQVRGALQLAREHSRSPQEVRFRLQWELDAGLPRPEVNCPIHDLDGKLVATVDLLDVEAGLVGEFDGADHRDGPRHTHDVRREDALRRLGLEVVTITGADLRDHTVVVDRLVAARARALHEPEALRRWVARPLPDRAEAALREKEDLAALAERNLALALDPASSW